MYGASHMKNIPNWNTEIPKISICKLPYISYFFEKYFSEKDFDFSFFASSLRLSSSLL